MYKKYRGREYDIGSKRLPGKRLMKLTQTVWNKLLVLEWETCLTGHIIEARLSKGLEELKEKWRYFAFGDNLFIFHTIILSFFTLQSLLLLLIMATFELWSCNFGHLILQASILLSFPLMYASRFIPNSKEYQTVSSD